MSKDFSLSDITDLIAKVNPHVCGFVVSQELYDGLRACLPQKFSGGNCFGQTPIVVDPALSGGECDVAFTRGAWHKRLQAIGQ